MRVLKVMEFNENDLLWLLGVVGLFISWILTSVFNHIDMVNNLISMLFVMLIGTMAVVGSLQYKLKKLKHEVK